MEYNSFYGGRRGASFVIVKRYRAIDIPEEEEDSLGNKKYRTEAEIAARYAALMGDEYTDKQEWLEKECMVYCFRKGGAYETVNYDEYVIIDTINKNDINNGKIFRRGYDYTNKIGGAVYIGQIQGPAGMAPHTLIKDWDAVKDMASEDNLELTDPMGDPMYRYSELTLDIDKNNGNESMLVPGKHQEKNEDGTPKLDENGFPISTYNDTIQIRCCSIRDADAHTSTAYVGFRIPYMIMDIESESVSPYYRRSDTGIVNPKETDWYEDDQDGYRASKEFTNRFLAERKDDETHPFFEKWNVKIPRGIKGDAFKRLRVTTVEEEIKRGTKIIGQDNQPIVLQTVNEDNKEWTNYTEEEYEDDNLTNKDAQKAYMKRKILVYDYYDYERVKGGDPVAYYLGDYNMIDEFEIKDDGTVVIEYSHDNTEVYSNLFKWVKDIELKVDTGLLTINYNFEQKLLRDETGELILDEDGNPMVDPDSEPTQYTTYLTWVKDVNIDDEGTISWTYTTPEDDKVYGNIGKWVKETKLDPSNGFFEVYYNYDKEYEVNQGKDVSEKGIYKLDENGKRIAVKDANGKEKTTYYSEYLQWIKDVIVEEDGSIIWTYTHKDDTDDKQIRLPNIFKWIEGIQLDYETGEFIIDYNYKNFNKVDKDGFDILDDNGNPIPKRGTETQYKTFLDWVKNVTLAADGTVTLHFTHKEDEDLPTKIKWVTDIQIVTVNDEDNPVEGTGTQKVKVTYNDGTSEEIGEPLNYIMDTKITKDYHLIVYHSDPEKRKEIAASIDESLQQYNGLDERYNVDSGEIWQDLGSVKDDDGILIGLHFDYMQTEYRDLIDIDNAIAYFNEQFPKGLVDPDLRGKIITCGKDDRNKDFYAFDYTSDDNGETYHGWYYLGKIESSSGSFAGREDDTDAIITSRDMAVGSLWFIIEDK